MFADRGLSLNWDFTVYVALLFSTHSTYTVTRKRPKIRYKRIPFIRVTHVAKTMMKLNWYINMVNVIEMWLIGGPNTEGLVKKANFFQPQNSL